MLIKTGLLTNVKVGNILIQTNYPCNKTNYAVCGSRDVKYLVIHYTGNTKDTAINNCKYFQGANRQASAHFFVDENTIQQSVALKDRAWHCGSLTNSSNDCVNQNSIGIEMCTSGNYLVSKKTQTNTIELVAYLCKMLNITDIDKYVIRHYDVGPGKKLCPAQFVNNPTEWTGFKQAVKEKMVKKINLQQWGATFDNIERIAYIPMNGTKGETLTAAAARATWNGRVPDAICNAEFFNMSDYKPASGVVSKANGQENWTDQWGISFVNNIIPKISFKNNLNSDDWVAGYPLLLKDGEIAIPKGFNALPGSRARTAIGYDDYRFAMFWVTEADGCTIEELAAAIKERGFHTAINLDGGGSTAGATTMWNYDQGRRTRGKIGIWIKNGTGNKLKKNTTLSNGSSGKYEIPPVNVVENKLIQDKSKSKGVALKVTANSGLYFRKTANGEIIDTLPSGSIVRWYGYYIVKNGVTWYCVLDSKNRTGYVSSQYVK